MPISFRHITRGAERALASLVLVFLLCNSAAAAPETVQLKANWTLASAKQAGDSGAAISQPGYSTKGWYPVRQVPATVLQILQEDGVYPNLYVGKNLLTTVPQDLYKQDWWYRTSFTAPAQGKAYWLEFPGINYRAEIWLNGKRIADNKQVVGMYVATELNVTGALLPGQTNTLAVKVTPERAIQDINGVELADSWFDWLNGKYLGSRLPPGQNGIPTSFVSDRNAGNLEACHASRHRFGPDFPPYRHDGASASQNQFRQSHRVRHTREWCAAPGAWTIARADFAAGQAGDGISAASQSGPKRKPRNRFHAGSLPTACRQQSGSLVALHHGPVESL